MKPRDFIQALENPELPGLSAHDERSEALLGLLVHMFFADRHVDKGEVEVLRRLAADVTNIPLYLVELSDRPLDLDKLAALFPDAQDRDDIVTLAEHAVWGDNQVDSREWDLMDQLVEKLGVIRP